MTHKLLSQFTFFKYPDCEEFWKYIRKIRRRRTNQSEHSLRVEFGQNGRRTGTTFGMRQVEMVRGSIVPCLSLGDNSRISAQVCSVNAATARRLPLVPYAPTHF